MTALRLPNSLAELGSRPLFAEAAATVATPPDAVDLAAWLQQARRQPAEALDWSKVFKAVSGGWLQGAQSAQLVGLLAAASEHTREQL